MSETDLLARIDGTEWRRGITVVERRAFSERGVAVLDNAAPTGIATEVSDLFRRSNWDQVHDQVRERHYQHVFKMDSLKLPGTEEQYMAHFRRSSSLEKNDFIPVFFDRMIKPVLEEVLQKRIVDQDVRCIGMFSGDYQRAHIDDYAGDIGFIYYLSPRWVWDWGGLLGIVIDEQADFIMPEFNRLVALNHGENRHPHFVTRVADFAREGRLTIVGFCRSAH